MISVSEAIELIRMNKKDLGSELVGLLKATGRVLSQDITADRDFPPFDRVTMDGIAISNHAFNEGRRSYMIAKIQAAGGIRQALEDPATCIEVMTGAVLPQGCDAVIPYEDCNLSDGAAVIKAGKIVSGQNIHPKASDEKAGQLLVASGAIITPSITGIAAAVGLPYLLVRSYPKIAVCSTGDELVAIDAFPETHQIRRSNAFMLAAALDNLGMVATLYHLPDEPKTIKQQLSALIPSYDVLLFSGAVSKGKYDFLPQVLNDAGMQTIFHRVAQKPGKPLLFGVLPDGPIVFGFPGNPVSTLVCFQVFFSEWLRASLDLNTPNLTAVLGADFTFSPSLSYHLPVTITLVDGQLTAMPNAGTNSGDMVSLVNTTAVITLPASRSEFKKGEVFPLTWLHPSFCN